MKYQWLGFQCQLKIMLSQVLLGASCLMMGQGVLAKDPVPSSPTGAAIASPSTKAPGTASSTSTGTTTAPGTSEGKKDSVPKDSAPADKAPSTQGDPKAAKGVEKPSGSALGTIVELKTSEGVIKIELNDKEAPITVKNFLSYVEDKFYDGLVFHRVIKDFMIQGGGYIVEGDRLVEKPTKAPIANEAKNGLKNNRGTIAMARTQDPNSATAQFYINHVNNNNLDHPSFDGHGYAVFGKVIEGMDVVDKIANVKTGVRGGMPDVPLNDVKIISIQTVKPAGH